MKVNKTYRSLLDKSIGSMLSAIEIYNKPAFHNREEVFAILAVNSCCQFLGVATKGSMAKSE